MTVHTALQALLRDAVPLPPDARFQQRAAPPAGDNPLEFVMSDDTTDRMGDAIDQAGWQLAHFRKAPVALFNHDRNQVIGRWRDVAVRGGRLTGFLELAEEGTSALVDSIRKLVAQKILRAVSVGFRPLAAEPLDPENKWGAQRFTKCELLECSLVSVPANPNALAIARSFGLPPAAQAILFGKHAAQQAGGSSASMLKPLVQKSTTMQLQTATLGQQIQAAHADFNALQARLAELTGKENPSDDEVRALDELPDRIDAAADVIHKLQRREHSLALTITGNGGERGREPAPVPPERRPSRAVKKLEPIDYFFRAATCFALAKANRSPDPMEFCRERYSNDEHTAQIVSLMTRAAPGPALTSQATWAAELVQVGFGEFLSTLKPFRIYPSIALRGPRFTFGPQAGTIKLPARSATPTVAGTFVGEAQPIPVKKLGLTSITLTPFKMAVISMFSEEIGSRSTPQIESLLRQEMEEDTAVAIDTALIDANAASTTRPAGLRNGVAGLTPTASGTPTEKMVADLKQLIGAITAVNGGRDIVVILNPLQAMSLTFAQTTTGDFLFATSAEAGARFNVSFVASNTCTAGMLIAVDAADFASATGDMPRFRLSAEATVHDEDTTPLPISTTGTPNVVAAPVRSFFQTDVMGIRMIWDMSWAMRRTGMVAWMTGVTW
jgi:HK97 family phage prohead protease